MAKCAYCHKKADWCCNCQEGQLLCRFHTKMHQSPQCRLSKPQVTRFCKVTQSVVQIILRKQLNEVNQCIKEVTDNTNRLLQNIKEKSEKLLESLLLMKGKLDEKMRKVTEFCISLEEVQKLLCEVFIRCDNYGTEELKVVDRYFGQQFLKEEPKMCLTIAHIEQAKNFLKNNYRLFVEGHFDCVAGTLVSSDNKLVVSAGDETIRIWDLEKMTQEGMIQCQESSILSITLTRNLKYIIGGGSDSVVYVWDFNDRKAKCELRGHSKSVLCLAVGKSNEIVVSGGGDGKVKVWNFVQKFLMANFDAHSNRVKSLIFTKDSKFIVSGGWDENVKIWKFKKKSLFMSINFRPDYVNSVCLTENSLLVAGHGNKISLYNLNFKKFEKTIKAHEYRVNSLFLAKSGKYLASAGQDKILKLWFMNELTLFKQFDLKIDITSICFSIDGSAIIVGCEDKTLKRVTISKEEVLDFQSHTESVTCIKGTPENQFIITGGNDNDIRIWSLKDRVSIAVLHGHSDWVTSLFVIPNNKYLISGGSDKIVRIWNLKSYKCEYELKGSKFEITSITYSPLTNLLVTGTEALALVWRIKDEKLSSFGFSS